MNAASRRNDPVWEQALDWLMQAQAMPGDAEVVRRRDLWIAENDAHARAYRKAEKVWRLTGDVVPAFPVSPVSTPVIAIPHTRRGTRGVILSAAIAACLALLAMPSLSLLFRADFRTGTGEARQVALADGSTVDLDAESAIDVSLSSDRRAVALLSGRAFFQVAKDGARPFVVTNGETTVTVTGTAFDVGSAEDEVAVEVQSGSVLVAVEHEGRKSSAALERGGRARISCRDGTLAVDSIPPAQVGIWRSGRMVVNGATIAQVVEDMRHRYHGIILLRDKGLAARQVTGVFDVADPIAALDAVLQPHGGTVREVAPYVLVVSAR